MTNPETQRNKSATVTRVGIVLILVSGVLWFSVFAVPFLPMSVGQRAALAGVVFLGAQITWWTGVVLAGPQTVARILSWCRIGKKPDEP